MKIIFFPFAGGNKYSYNSIDIDPDNSIFLEYPGRGKRCNESLFTSFDNIVDDALKQLKAYFNGEYILFGHSMGALVCYSLCKKIEIGGYKKPERLIVSGMDAPVKIQNKEISHLPSKLFWEELNKYGGLPNELKNYENVKQYFEPILRADFQCVENYKYNSKTPKLDIPIDVFYGSEEDITDEEAQAWQEETTGKTTVTKLTGDHFFIYDHKDFFSNYFNQLQLRATI